MSRAKRVGVIGGIVLAVLVLLGIVQVIAAGWIFDSKKDAVVRRVEQAVPGLSLQLQETASTLASRSLRVNWRLKLPEGNALGLDYLAASTQVDLSFGLLKAAADFKHVPHSGNLDELFAKFKLKELDYAGTLQATALLPKVTLDVKSTPFTLPLEYGSCEVGQNVLKATASSTDDIDVELNAAGFKCGGSEIYAGKPSFNLSAEDLKLALKPRLDLAQKRVYADSFEISLKSFIADVSTLFGIGFDPDAEVKDPTLRDRVEFEDVKARLAFEDKDSQDRAYLNVKGSGSFALAFPYVKEGAQQEPYRINNLVVDGRIGKADVKGIFKALGQLGGEQGLAPLMACFSNEQEFVLNRFSFDHAGEQVTASGHSAADLDFAALKIRSMQADFSFSGGAGFVRDLAGSEYTPALDELTAQGQVSFDGRDYRTRLTINNQDIRLNGLPLSLHSAEDDYAYPEEPAENLY